MKLKVGNSYECGSELVTIIHIDKRTRIAVGISKKGDRKFIGLCLKDEWKGVCLFGRFKESGENFKQNPAELQHALECLKDIKVIKSRKYTMVWEGTNPILVETDFLVA